MSSVWISTITNVREKSNYWSNIKVPWGRLSSKSFMKQSLKLNNYSNISQNIKNLIIKLLKSPQILFFYTQSNLETCWIPGLNSGPFKVIVLYIKKKNWSLFESLVSYSAISISWVYRRAQQMNKKGKAHTQVI